MSEKEATMQEELELMLQTLGDLEREDVEQSSYLRGRADGTGRSRRILLDIYDDKIARPVFSTGRDSGFKSGGARMLSTANGRQRPEPPTLASAIRRTLRQQGTAWTKVNDLAEMLAKQGIKISRTYLLRVLRADLLAGAIESPPDRPGLFRVVPREDKAP